MRVFLTGFMGSGKSSLGKRVARLLNLKFIDLDKLIEERCRTSIPLLFDRYGEEVFRMMEQRYLHEIVSDHCLIAVGGGTPCFFDNMEFMKRNGLVVWLNPPKDELVKRLSETKKNRPLLQGKDVDAIRKAVEEKLNERIQYYSQAHLVIDDVSPVPEKVAELIKNLNLTKHG
ncbi:MAG: shikimate kinase [Bacteroidales bacterium]